MIDYTGIPSAECPECGGLMFKTWVQVDPESYDVMRYGADGECYECGTKYTLAVPSDLNMEEEEEDYGY